MSNDPIRELEKSEHVAAVSAKKESPPPEVQSDKDIFRIEEIDAVPVESMVTMRC